MTARESGDQRERRPHTKRDRIKRLRERVAMYKRRTEHPLSETPVSDILRGILDLLEDEL